MSRRMKSGQRPEKVLDTFSGKRGKGRPGVRASEIRGRADRYRLIFSQIWDVVGEPLLKAKTDQEVIQAFEEDGRYTKEFASITGLILRVIHDPLFPKRYEPRIRFLADSLAGRGGIRPRTSRNICERERKKKVHQIIRQEYYIECTCGYKGPALRGKCPKCGPDELFRPFLGFLS